MLSLYLRRVKQSVVSAPGPLTDVLQFSLRQTKTEQKHEWLVITPQHEHAPSENQDFPAYTEPEALEGRLGNILQPEINPNAHSPVRKEPTKS